ncbi:response regulator [Myxococcota bacterium]|nr:response regulator [Myxococcota bacterium]
MVRMLVADDASFMRMMIREIVEDEGYEIVGEASDGLEAIAMYGELHPDIVTMDIVMPRCSGIDAVRGIINLDPGAAIVMCSALGQDSLITESVKAGAKDFIVKPFRPEAVIETLRLVLEKES